MSFFAVDGEVASPALLNGSGASQDEIIVHPLVLLSVLDHHTRRQEGASRVIGTLLGRRLSNKIEITNCFAVPHAERGDEVAIGKDFNKQMLALHLRANPDEVVVGWYASTSPEGLIVDTSYPIHEFYSGECENQDPIHLVVDTRLETDQMPIRAFKSSPVFIQGEPLANLFHEVKLSMNASESEAICLDRMSDESPLVQDNTNLKASMEKLLSLLDASTAYVDGVVEGTSNPNPSTGRKLADALAVIPRVRPEVFDRLFNESLQDLLMVTYLSKITRTQLHIAEKLNASLSV